jgi:hypothetical protein
VCLRCRHTLLFFDTEHPLGPEWSFSGDHDSVVTPRELCAYVSETVRTATGAQQVPEYRFADTEADSPVLSLGH